MEETSSSFNPCISQMEFVERDSLRPGALPVANPQLFPSKLIFSCSWTCYSRKTENKVTCINVEDGDYHLQVTCDIKTRAHTHTRKQ